MEPEYAEILSQSKIKCIRELKNMKTSSKKESYFMKKLNDAKKLGEEWEGRDIRYIMWYNQLEKEKENK